MPCRGESSKGLRWERTWYTAGTVRRRCGWRGINESKSSREIQMSERRPQMLAPLSLGVLICKVGIKTPCLHRDKARTVGEAPSPQPSAHHPSALPTSTSWDIPKAGPTLTKRLQPHSECDGEELRKKGPAGPQFQKGRFSGQIIQSTGPCQQS